MLEEHGRSEPQEGWGSSSTKQVFLEKVDEKFLAVESMWGCLCSAFGEQNV